MRNPAVVTLLLMCSSLFSASFLDAQIAQPRHAEQSHPPLTAQQALELRWGLFFADLRMDEELARDNEKNGRHGFATKWYGRIQTDTGLTDEQMEAVRAIAKEYLDGSEEQAKDIATAAHAYRAQNPGAGKAQSPEVQALVAKRHKFCEDEVGKLVIALGSKNFATLDAYASREFPTSNTSGKQDVSK